MNKTKQENSSTSENTSFEEDWSLDGWTNLTPELLEINTIPYSLNVTKKKEGVIESVPKEKLQRDFTKPVESFHSKAKMSVTEFKASTPATKSAPEVEQTHSQIDNPLALKKQNNSDSFNTSPLQHETVRRTPFEIKPVLCSKPLDTSVHEISDLLHRSILATPIQPCIKLEAHMDRRVCSRIVNMNELSLSGQKISVRRNRTTQK